MERAPPVYRFIDNGHIDYTNNCQNSASARAGGSTTHIVAHHQVATINKPENQCRGQARVPGPPCSPGSAPPDRASNQSERDKDRPGFGARAGQPVPAFIFLDKIDDTCEREDDKG